MAETIRLTVNGEACTATVPARTQLAEVLRDHLDLTGTHLGPLKVGDQVVPPTGKSFKVRMAGVFQFAPGSDKIVCERPYVDPAQIARQLGLG